MTTELLMCWTYSKARFTLGVRAQKNLRAKFEHFWLVVSPKLLINARTLIVRILINAETLAPRVANWPPKFDGVYFSALGPIQGHKFQHLSVTLGRLKRIFLKFCLDS